MSVDDPACFWLSSRAGPGKSGCPVKERDRIGWHEAHQERGGNRRGRLIEEELPLGHWSMDWWHRHDSESSQRMMGWGGSIDAQKGCTPLQGHVHLCVRTITQEPVPSKNTVFFSFSHTEFFRTASSGSKVRTLVKALHLASGPWFQPTLHVNCLYVVH